jgi:hypothetical protein
VRVGYKREDEERSKISSATLISRRGRGQETVDGEEGMDKEGRREEGERVLIRPNRVE